MGAQGLRFPFAVLLIALAPWPAAAQSCSRAKHGDPFYAELGTASIARGETRTLFICSVKATEMTLVFTPPEGLTVAKVEETAVPDSMAKRGMRPMKGHHLFNVTVSAAADAPLGKRAYLAQYADAKKEKPDVIVVASHLPQLIKAEVIPHDKSFDIAVTVLDSLQDFDGTSSLVTKSGRGVMFSAFSMLDAVSRKDIVMTTYCEGTSGYYLPVVDSVQVVDAHTRRAFFTWKDNHCSGTLMVRDAEGNESAVRLRIEMERKK